VAGEARFAGIEAAIGIIVLLIVWSFGAIGAIGVILLFATGTIPATAEYLGWSGVGLLAIGWYGRHIWRDFHLIRVVEITEDDHWILRSVFGLVRGRLAPNQARELVVKKANVWRWVGVPRRYTVGWAEITAGGRSWKTTQNPPEDQRPAVALLSAWMQAHS